MLCHVMNCRLSHAGALLDPGGEAQVAKSKLVFVHLSGSSPHAHPLLPSRCCCLFLTPILSTLSDTGICSISCFSLMQVEFWALAEELRARHQHSGARLQQVQAADDPGACAVSCSGPGRQSHVCALATLQGCMLRNVQPHCCAHAAASCCSLRAQLPRLTLLWPWHHLSTDAAQGRGIPGRPTAACAAHSTNSRPQPKPLCQRSARQPSLAQVMLECLSHRKLKLLQPNLKCQCWQ